MQNKKLKILMVSEASFLSSGFGTYTKEILSRLYATDKYEIAEFACYGKVNDPKDKDIHWRYYANAVGSEDPRSKEYNSSMENQFGRWRFERVLLDFRPDVVIDVRDYWMNAYQQFSPLRPFFHWILMPTVDSAPQQEDWIDTFMHADAIFTYSDFGRDTLADQSNNKINYIDTVSPGVSLDIFKPLPNRQEVKKALGVDDKFIIGGVMRNQKRKLIPELFAAFKQLLNKMQEENNPIGEKLFLHLHTSYPDAGWDLPKLLKEYEVGNRVLFTYSCKNCGFFRPSKYSHPLSVCPKCGSKSFSMPNVSSGLSQTDLNVIFNTFDFYVQYAICEGFGMPQVEAGAAGVPIASVDYSAMNDVVNKLNGYPIKVNQFFKELETQAIRVYPDNDSFVEILTEYLNLPDVLKEQKRHETRQLVEKYYNWDDIAKKWETYLDNIKLTGLQGQWDQRIPPIQPTGDLNKDGNAYDVLINWISTNMPHHQISTSISTLNMIRNLDYGFAINGMQTQNYNMDNVKSNLEIMINNHNTAMIAKDQPDKMNKEDYIEYANMKDQTK
jgi:glycosyltransferase involved in cell wall biosynthesis|tara:strand:- start:342 stop:2006 length:1665 start_codon:yes stop_codon:yes gene_type:complete